MDKHYFCTINILYKQADCTNCKIARPSNVQPVQSIYGSSSYMEAFKNPLTPEEEKKYIALCLSGDKAARSILIEYNLRLVAHISRKYNSAVRDPEDLLSIGTIGLIKAIDSYKPDKGCKLSGYAAKCIENELLMTLRHEKKKAREVSIYDPIGTDKEGNEIVILDIIGSENVNVLDKMIQDDHLCLLPSCISSLLSSREREIICMRYGLDRQSPLTQKEVARLLGISRSYVSRIEKKALIKLRGCLD